MKKITASIPSIVIVIIMLSAFVGMWHAFPLTTVVDDEMYFAGGVLRSLHAHSFFPQALDVPYGTITFYAAYPLMILMLLFFVPIVGMGNIVAFVSSNLWFAYIPVRFLSAIITILLVIILERFWRSYVEDIALRIGLLVLLFWNLLVLTILHTGKVWVLSTLFFQLSFLFLVRAIERNDRKGKFLSVLFSFLAFANFPLMGVALLNLPILLWHESRSSREYKRFAAYIFAGMLVFALVLVSNFSAISAQVKSILFDYSMSPKALTHNLSVWESLVLNFKKVILFFPLILIALSATKKFGVPKNQQLQNLALLYSVVYFVVISAAARWSTDTDSLVRYLFPLPFFLAHFAAARVLRKNVLCACAGATAVFAIVIMIHLARPTTYNLARSWVIEELAGEDAKIINRVPLKLTLPRNKQAWELTRPEFCGSACKAVTLWNVDPRFRPIVIDDLSLPGQENMDSVAYLVVATKNESHGELIAMFPAGLPDGEGTVSDNLANYFDKKIWVMDRFGTNIYIYRQESARGPR